MLVVGPFSAPNSCMFGAITHKPNLSLPFVILNLLVQCQSDPYTYTQIIVRKQNVSSDDDSDDVNDADDDTIALYEPKKV